MVGASGGETVGLGEVVEASLDAHDGDGEAGLAGDVVRAVGRDGGDGGGDAVPALVVVHEHGDRGDGERAGVGALALRVVAAGWSCPVFVDT